MTRPEITEFRRIVGEELFQTITSNFPNKRLPGSKQVLRDKKQDFFALLDTGHLFSPKADARRYNTSQRTIYAWYSAWRLQRRSKMGSNR